MVVHSRGKTGLQVRISDDFIEGLVVAITGGLIEVILLSGAVYFVLGLVERKRNKEQRQLAVFVFFQRLSDVMNTLLKLGYTEPKLPDPTQRTEVHHYIFGNFDARLEQIREIFEFDEGDDVSIISEQDLQTVRETLQTVEEEMRYQQLLLTELDESSLYGTRIMLRLREHLRRFDEMFFSSRNEDGEKGFFLDPWSKGELIGTAELIRNFADANRNHLNTYSDEKYYMSTWGLPTVVHGMSPTGATGRLYFRGLVKYGLARLRAFGRWIKSVVGISSD